MSSIARAAIGGARPQGYQASMKEPNAEPEQGGSEGERIAKVLARAGLCSRREASRREHSPARAKTLAMRSPSDPPCSGSAFGSFMLAWYPCGRAPPMAARAIEDIL